MFQYPTDHSQPPMGDSNTLGTFPVGRLHTWHGGIHIETNNAVKVVADGVIVAFRIAENYMKSTINGQESLYSNSFVLVQHQHKMKDETEIVYYSLYNHLCPQSEMNTEYISDVFQKATFKVSTNKNTETERGIYIFSDDSKVFVPQNACLLPDSTTNTLVGTKDGFKLKKTPFFTLNNKFEKIIYVNKDGISARGFYASKNDIQKINRDGIDYFIVKSNNITQKKKNGFAGIYEYAETKVNSKILRVIPKDTEIELEPKPIDGNWYKVKYPKDLSDKKYDYISDKNNCLKGYVNIPSNQVKYQYAPPPSKGSDVLNCAMPVTAGMILANAGIYGTETYTNYRTVHIEIFAGEDELVESFLSDDSGSKNFIKIKKNSQLINEINYKLDKDFNVKAIRNYKDYTQIEIVGDAKDAHPLKGKKFWVKSDEVYGAVLQPLHPKEATVASSNNEPLQHSFIISENEN